MEKNESLKLEPTTSAKPRISGAMSKVLGLSKCALGICVVPCVYAVSVAFLREFGLVRPALQQYFWSGVVTFLLIYLFIWEPVVIYSRGQRLLELVFTFFKPLVRVAPYLLPIYALVLSVIYMIGLLWKPGEWFREYFISLLGFFIALHLVFGAKSMRTKKEDFLRANYLFGFSFVYILNVLLLAGILSAVVSGFSFVNFSTSSYQIAHDIFYGVFQQLFLR